MEQSGNYRVVLDLKEMFYNLVDHILILMLSGITLAFIAGLGSKLILKPVYISSASLYIINQQDKESNMTLTDLQTGMQLTKDYQILIKSRPVMEQVISDLGLDLGHEQLVKMITVNAPADTRIVEIVVKNRDAYTAKLLVDSIANISAKRMLNVMDMDMVNVIEKGSLPTRPASPNVMINTLTGAILGVLLASFIIILLDLLNDSIKNAEDIEKYLGLVTLCEVPIEENLLKQNKFKRISIRMIHINRIPFREALDRILSKIKSK